MLSPKLADHAYIPYDNTWLLFYDISDLPYLFFPSISVLPYPFFPRISDALSHASIRGHFHDAELTILLELLMQVLLLLVRSILSFS
ncbi:hypothetical protein D3C80_1136820 [compost metagenome]